MHVGRCGVGAVAALTFIALALLLSGCGSSNGATASSTTLATTATSSEAAAVVAGYRAAWHAFEDALDNANPNDPLLASTMVDPQLQGVKANLLADQRQGIVGRGPTTVHPKVVSLSTARATIVDCVHSATELVYASSGTPVPPVTPPENDGVSATMVLSNGVWKLEKQTVSDGKCAAGS